VLRNKFGESREKFSDMLRSFENWAAVTSVLVGEGPKFVVLDSFSAWMEFSSPSCRS